MRNYSNQQGSRPSSGNRGGYGGNRGGGYNREHRGDRDNRGGGYKGQNPRYDRGEHRGEHRHGGGGYRPSHSPSGHRMERYERHEREERPRYERSESQGPRGSSWVEVTGRSVEEAIEEASRRFNVGKDNFKTEVVEEGSKGFLGIGSKPAKVKISLKPAAVPPFAEGVLSRLLRGMSLPDTVKVQKDEDGNTVLNIQGPSSGTLIGRHGHTLEALQYLVSKVVQRMTGDEKSIIIVDVESYLERQRDKLKELAVNLAQKAKETGVEIPMRPMSSKDRRVVHMALKDHEHVTTESRGEGLRRKVVIVPKVKAEATAAAAPAAPAAPEHHGEAVSHTEQGNELTPQEPGLVMTDPSDEKPSNPAKPSAGVLKEDSSEQPEPGNVAPKEPEVDDNIGNKA